MGEQIIKYIGQKQIWRTNRKYGGQIIKYGGKIKKYGGQIKNMEDK